MGNQEIWLLPTRFATLWDLDRSQALSRDILKGSKQLRKSKADEVQREDNVLQLLS